MNLNFKPVEAEDMSRLRPFYGLRPNRTCDSVFLDSFLWKDYYKVKCAVSEDRAALWLMEKDGILSSAMPLCKEEDLPHFFYQMVDYFDNVLHKPFHISLADAEAVEYLDLDPEKFEVTELDDLKDYLYDGNAMRTLAGKKLHKKKNHVNAFLREYDGRYEYRRLVRSCRLRWERETYCLACLRLAACREESRVFRPWQAGLTGEVAMEGADLLSIRMELREVRGDGRPLLSCSGVTWDWKAGAPVPLGVLLPERSFRRQLLEGIRQAGEGELRRGSCLLDPDWKETARRKFRASRFCLRPEGIELFYPQCFLAPAVEGVLSFRVPLAGAAWTAGEGTASET